jgi:hypothetical protein
MSGNHRELMLLSVMAFVYYLAASTNRGVVNPIHYAAPAQAQSESLQSGPAIVRAVPQKEEVSATVAWANAGAKAGWKARRDALARMRPGIVLASTARPANLNGGRSEP